MIKLDKNQIDSLEKVKDREELCEKIYQYLVEKKDSFKAYQVNYDQLKPEIYKSFDLLVSLLLTDNEVICQLIVWNTIMRKDVLNDSGIQAFIKGSNLRGKDLLATLEYYELRD
ncbi:hypothetical protein OHV99_18145 [Acinetobacter baumannii]|uniref:hypothetical protein n=1 Tax=Acinetobacter calcoaceticus/baumannii complex TaxID=909768 RepID=UPI00233F0B5D|nr:hypothetical protein [Acinetobacter baumannii]HCA5286827.1 hypothetical protein [Acinetobacter nosocomialis]MDC4923599.1 hypothetical protein [Acinetobacter baumannii]MDC5345573.1 hypothetical protein [Acinetobacter baumannii]MDC5568472.1 hypothetical protein [Acinetobacter baumannii]MDK2172835.1 hypothetical protein [Acinetobacter baumannii]